MYMATGESEAKVVIKLQVSPEASTALDEMALSRKRKGELMDKLILAAHKRLADVRAHKAPLDEFTSVLIDLEYQRNLRAAQQDAEEAA